VTGMIMWCRASNLVPHCLRCDLYLGEYRASLPDCLDVSGIHHGGPRKERVPVGGVPREGILECRATTSNLHHILTHSLSKNPFKA